MVASRQPCDDCGSSDAVAVYADGHSHCYSCGKHKHDGEPTRAKPTKSVKGLINGQIQSLSRRLIREDTCRRYGYAIGKLDGKAVQIAPYYRNGTVVAQKVRFANKDFSILGESKGLPLFGQHLFSEGGRMLLVTEGEIDCLTVSQECGDNKYPAVSVPNGAKAAAKAIAANLEFVESFGKVVFMFDMDKPGQDAAVECAELLTPGKAAIAHLPFKDANECLVQGEGALLVTAQWQAKAYSPPGILSINDVIQMIEAQDEVPRIPYMFDLMEEKLVGFRRPSIVTVCAGSGVGKTEFVREMAYDLMDRGECVGYIPLEEEPERTALGLAGVRLNREVHDLEAPLDADGVRDALSWLNDHCIVVDASRSTGPDWIVSKVRYLAVARGCRYVVLDHLSHLIAEETEGDERRIIDNLMTKLKKIVVELRIGLLLVSHLKDPGKNQSHEEGARTRLNQLRGSRGIGHLSWVALGIERDQQGDDPCLAVVRCLKNRPKGWTGPLCAYRYDRDTGRLREAFLPMGFDTFQKATENNREF